MKTGLVMEGGAMRGMFTAGVTDVMMENGITYDGAVGVSAGAVFGCNYKSRQPGRVIRYNKRFAKDWRFCSVRSLLLTGDLFGAEFCYKTIPQDLDYFDVEAFAENPMNFYVVCTDMETGRAVYHNCLKGDERDLKWMRASASMPLASRAVVIDGRKLSDGGTADSIPLRYMQHKGYDKNVVILTQPPTYRKKLQKSFGAIEAGLFRYPVLARALKARPERYNRSVEYVRSEEAAGRAFVICPRESLNIGHTEHDPAELERVYQIGRAEAEKRLPELMEFLKEDVR